MTVMPRDDTEWTVDDLVLLPDDGLQYELLDGVLLVSPAPVLRHQRAVGRLFSLLVGACPPDLEVFLAPIDWQPDRRTSLQPDLLVVERQLIGADDKNLTVTLALAVEVLSPSTRRKDEVFKRSKYEEVGVTSFWTVDSAIPSITCFDLVDGRYAEVASGSAPITVTLPFPLTITPSALIN